MLNKNIIYLNVKWFIFFIIGCCFLYLLYCIIGSIPSSYLYNRYVPLDLAPQMHFSIRDMDINTKGNMIASVGSGGNVILWDLSNGNEIRKLKGPGYSLLTVAFSPTGEFLAGGGLNRRVKIWDLKKGEEYLAPFESAHWVKKLAFSQDGNRLASSSLDVDVWDIHNGKRLFNLKCGDYEICALSYKPGGTSLLVGNRDGSIYQCNDEMVSKIFSISPRDKPIKSMAFSLDCKKVGIGTITGLLDVWDVESKLNCFSLESHKHLVYCIQFSPDGKLIATGSDDGTIKIWNSSTGNQIACLDCQEGYILKIIFNPNGKEIISAGEGNIIHKIDYNWIMNNK